MFSPKRHWLVSGAPAVLFIGALALAPAFGQDAQDQNAPAASSTSSTSSSTPAPAQNDAQPKSDKQEPPPPPGGTHVFGVLPNYRTVDASEVHGPLTARQKFTIASKDSFDYPLVILSAALAGFGQLTNQNPSFGQGVEGYSKRLVTGYADQAIGNMMTEGIFPALLHEDPRYYRRGTGTKWSRTGYALTRIFVTHTDSGGMRFNYSEWVGNAVGTAISNAYYPDNRTVGDNVTKLVEQCGIDAISQVMKEFWPDIKHHFFEHHNAATTPTGFTSQP